MPKLTKKAWFGPKRYVGWGWRIASWEGRLVTAVVAALVVVSVIVWHGAAVIPIVVLVVLYLGVVLLTGDPPGGPASGPNP